MPLEIRVLGPLEVLVDGEPLRVDTRKAPAILALLAVEGRPYARDELAAIFWPESDDESARGAFRRTLSVLRSALGDRWLRVDRSTVGLVAGDDVTLDLGRLDAAAARGNAAGLEDCRRAGEPHLEAAVESNLADQLHAAGRPDEAMVHLKRAVTLFAKVGGRPGELEPEIWRLVS